MRGDRAAAQGGGARQPADAGRARRPGGAHLLRQPGGAARAGPRPRQRRRRRHLHLRHGARPAAGLKMSIEKDPTLIFIDGFYITLDGCTCWHSRATKLVAHWSPLRYIVGLTALCVSHPSQQCPWHDLLLQCGLFVQNFCHLVNSDSVHSMQCKGVIRTSSYWRYCILERRCWRWSVWRWKNRSGCNSRSRSPPMM